MSCAGNDGKSGRSGNVEEKETFVYVLRVLVTPWSNSHSFTVRYPRSGNAGEIHHILLQQGSRYGNIDEEIAFWQRGR